MTGRVPVAHDECVLCGGEVRPREVHECPPREDRRVFDVIGAGAAGEVARRATNSI